MANERLTIEIERIEIWFVKYFWHQVFSKIFYLLNKSLNFNWFNIMHLFEKINHAMWIIQNES